MLRFSRSKIIATVAIIVIGLLLAVPSTDDPRAARRPSERSIPSWVPSWLVPSRAIVLGLDLQGGSHVLLEVDGQDLLRTQITTAARRRPPHPARHPRLAPGRHPD